MREKISLPSAIVDNLIDEGGRKVVFGTRFIDIPIINAYMNGALFLVNWDKIGNPVCESHRINKAELSEVSRLRA
jgi:hypothetical protein